MNNTIFNNHPIIKNSNQYFLEKKYISIHSEDRDISKYPISSEFELLLPQEYLNVASAKLSSWSFPSNYNVFSVTTYNVVMSFKFLDLYNPAEHTNSSNSLTNSIFIALYEYSDKQIIVTIEPGFYNPDQMATELTNQFNQNVTNIINDYFNDPNNNISQNDKDTFEQEGGYKRFTIAYNSVGQKLYFGNQADKFIITNEASSVISSNVVNNTCLSRSLLPELVNWGLPSYLGFSRCNVTAYSVSEYIDLLNELPFYTNLSNRLVPRFFYIPVDDACSDCGNNGIWIEPDTGLTGSTIYYLQAPFKISFMGPSYLYMEIDGWNCIDETSPYNLNLYTIQTNKRNSIVNSSFAKIPIPTTPISQYYDDEMAPYKYWNPVAERISKIKVKFRYHNGLLADFGQFEYSFMLELNILKPQQEKSYSIVNSYDLSQQQSYGSKFV